MSARKIFSLAAVPLLLLSSPLWANWVQDGGSLNVNAGKKASAPTLALANGTLYVSWFETSGITDSQIYVKHWNGSTWIQDGGSLNVNAASYADYPNLAAANNTPYVCWEEMNSSNILQVFVKHWNGSAWIQDGGSLNVNSAQDANAPKVGQANGTPYVAWYEFPVPYQIYVKHWNGSSWIQDNGSLNVNSSQYAADPTVAAANGLLYAGFAESNGVALQLYIKHLNGSSWQSTGGSLNMNTMQSASRPSLAPDLGNMYVAWNEASGSIASLIYVKHWNGSSWTLDGSAINLNPTHRAIFPCLAFGNNAPYISWQEANSSGYTNYQILVKHYSQGSWIQDGGPLNVNAAQSAFNPSLVLNNGTPYVAWCEPNGATPDQLYVKHYLLPTSTPTAAPTIPAVTASPTPTVTPWPSSTMVWPPVPRADFTISNNQINPEHGDQAIIRWTQPWTGPATIAIYNLLGDRVITLVNSLAYQAGQYHEVRWNGRNQDGQACASGIYIVLIRTEGRENWGKVAVIK